jgi:hypothetical protein
MDYPETLATWVHKTKKNTETLATWVHKTKKNNTKTQHNMCCTPLCVNKHK